MEVFLFVIIPLVLFVGSILGLVSYSKVKNIEVRLLAIERKLNGIKDQQDITVEKDEPADFAEPEPQVSKVSSLHAPTESGWNNDSDKDDLSTITYPAPHATKDESYISSKTAIDWAALVQQYWMVVLGGVCLVFAGVFLVRYSIEHGFLGPSARVISGLIFGTGLIVGCR